jgi:16S rRNA (guanine527-N7)-methyltransferase
MELAHWSGELGVKLSPEQLGLFQTYLHELRAWNRKTNLTAITDPQEIIVKHFLDSLACRKGLLDFSTNSELLDIGSGAGFPGLPLKIVMPELTVTLLEPASKKIAFLQHIVGTLQLKNVRAIPKTIEAFGLDHTNHKKFSYVISRALNMSPIIERCFPLLSVEGRLILCRSKPFSETEKPGMFEVERELSYDLPCGYGHRVLSILKRP